MAPNGHAPSEARDADRSNQNGSRPVWLEKHGDMEFKEWQKEHPANPISQKAWEKSKDIEGLTLYYAALQIWNESDSSVRCLSRSFESVSEPNGKQDDEVEQLKVEPRARGVRAQAAREPKKTLKSNGSGLARSAGSATPSSMAQNEDLSPSAKKKRKARKKYLVCRQLKYCSFTCSQA